MKEITFESALKDLEVIIKDLESGNIPLEEAITKYTDAMNLVKLCQEKLDKATKQVNKIIGENGELQDFKTDEGDTNGCQRQPVAMDKKTCRLQYIRKQN